METTRMNNLELKRWLHRVGPRRRDILYKIMNELQSLGLSRKKVCSGLVQLARNPHVCLDRQSIDLYVRKRKYEESSKGPSKSKQPEIDDNSRRKEMRTSGDHCTERLTDSRRNSNSPNNKSQHIEARKMISNADQNFIGKETHPSNDAVTKIDGKSLWSSPPKKVSSEKHVDRLKDSRVERSCRDCKVTCTCDDVSSSRDDDVFESDEDVSKKTPVSPYEKVPELIDDKVGSNVQRIPVQFDIGKIKLNLNNLPRLRERFLKEMKCEEKIATESNKNLSEETGADSFKKRRRISANVSVSIARKEKRTRRKREKIRQLFGDVQTLSEEESEQDMLNIPKRRKKGSSDSCDSGLCQEDDAFFNEIFIRNDVKTGPAREDIVEAFNCREMQFINDREIDETVASFPKGGRTEDENEDKDKYNEDKDNEIAGKDEDIENKTKKIADQIGIKENDETLSTTKEKLLLEDEHTTRRSEEINEDNTAAAADTILKDNIEITCSLSLSEDAYRRLSDKRDNLETKASHDSEDISNNSLLKKNIVSEHAREETTSSLIKQESINVNESSVVQKENNAKRCDLSVSISSESLSENVEDKRNVANIFDSEATKCNETNIEEAVKTVTTAEDKSVDDNVDNNSPQDVKPLIINMQELSKESLMSAAKNYFAEHLEDIIKNALVVKDAQQTLPEKMAKEFVESLSVPKTDCKEKGCDSENNIEVDANRNICEKVSDDTTSRITQRKNNELSSHTVSAAEETPDTVRTDTEIENTHLENATRMDNESTGSGEVNKSSSNCDKSMKCSTEVDNSQKKDEDSRKNDVESAGPPPATVPIRDITITPIDPNATRLRVRTGAELGARWCPTPAHSTAIPADLSTTITTNENIAPTSASVPPLPTISPTATVVPPPASAPPLTDQNSQGARTNLSWFQVRPFLVKVTNKVLCIRRNLEQQVAVSGLITHQPVNIEYFSKLQKECVAHAIALKQVTLNLIRMFGTPDVQKVLLFIVQQFNYNVKTDRNLTLNELSWYLNPEQETHTASLGNSSQKTAQYNKSTNNVQSTGNTVGGSPSYVRVNLPFESYMNAPIATDNASYVPNVTVGPWRPNNPHKPPTSYMTATATVTQQQTSNSGVNQVRVPTQNPMSFPNAYQTSQIPQTQRVPGVTPQNRGQASKYHINNILGGQTSQSVSSTVNVPHVTAQRTFQQPQPTLNVSSNVSQRMTSTFQNAQPTHPQQRVKPSHPNARFSRPLNLSQKNVGQVPQQAVNTPQTIQGTTLAPNMQYLQNMYEQVPKYVAQGVQQVNTQQHIMQQNVNSYQNTQQQSSLLHQNGHLLTAMSAESVLQRRTANQSQNLNPSSNVSSAVVQEQIPNHNVIQSTRLPAAPVQTIQNVFSSANLSTNVPRSALSSTTSNAKLSQTTSQHLQSNGILRELVTDKAKPPKPSEVNNVTQNSKVSQHKRTAKEKVTVPKTSFTNWSSFTEIQKIILTGQLRFYWKSGLSYVNLPKEKHQSLRVERHMLKLLNKALVDEVAKLQKTAEASMKNSSAENVTEQVVVSNERVTQRSSESLCNTVRREENNSAANIESQTNKAPHNSESSEQLQEQRANTETEKLQEVPTNSPTEVLDERDAESTLNEQPLTSLPKIVEDTYKMSNTGMLVSSEKETEASTEASKSSNVNEMEVVQESVERELEEVKEKSGLSSADEEQVKEIAHTSTSTEKERPETQEMNHLENPESSNRSSVPELQEIAEDASQLTETNIEANVSEDLQENSDNFDIVEKKTIKTEKSAPTNDDAVNDDFDQFEQMETGIPEEEISADLSVFEELMDDDSGMIFIEENSSEKILSQEELEAEFALVAYEQESDDIKFVIPNIADVRSIQPEVFEQINTKEDEIVIFEATNETVDFAESNDNTFPSDENGDILVEDILCLRCKRTQSMVVCKCCLEAHYCSKRCQELHWKAEHHKSCRQSTDMLYATERPSTSCDSS